MLRLLDAWKGLRARAADLGRQLVADARQSQACRIPMSIPGVGAITATSFATTIEEPGNFRKSRSVGAWIGLTTRRYQSDEVDYDGHIYPDAETAICAGSYTKRPRLFSRAVPNRVRCEHGGQLRERIGFKRAAVAVARKLAVIMHTMLKTGEFLNLPAGVAV